MIATRCTPLRIYNTAEKKRHKFAINSPKPATKNKEIEKLRLLVKWNIRATQSALKDSQDILEILEDSEPK
tara:strand:- start:3495 stop:3707 length:213 start_codon:yes stop_codon:yes gene_type:complete